MNQDMMWAIVLIQICACFLLEFGLAIYQMRKMLLRNFISFYVIMHALLFIISSVYFGYLIQCK